MQRIDPQWCYLPRTCHAGEESSKVNESGSWYQRCWGSFMISTGPVPGYPGDLMCWPSFVTKQDKLNRSLSLIEKNNKWLNTACNKHTSTFGCLSICVAPSEARSWLSRVRSFSSLALCIIDACRPPPPRAIGLMWVPT